MLVTFKSKAAADVLMYEEHAKPILALFGKEVKNGVITAAETAGAVAQLEAAIEESRRRIASEKGAADEDNGDDREPAPRQGVTFSARAYPLLEMLRAAQKTGKDVIWGA